MVERLGESYAVLESRVEERTAALQRSEARLRYVMDATGEGIWDWNIETGRVTHNPTWCELLGLDMTFLDHPMSTFVDVLHPDDREDALAQVDRCLKSGTPYRHEHRMRRPDGSVIWVLDRGAVVERDATGRPTRMVGSISDISESRAAQARLQDRTEQLNAIFTLSPDGFISFDKELKVKYVSPAIHKMLGLDEGELVGLAETGLLAKIAALCADSGIGDLAVLQRTDERTSPQDRVLIELAQPGKRVLEVGLRRSRAETVSQILYFRDVTHETEVDRMKSEFLSTAAHELRTPMASVYGFSELLLNQEFDESTRRDVLTTIFRQSELMASIINELLDLARIEARRGKDFVIERIEVGPFVQAVATGYKPPGGRPLPALGLPKDPVLVRGDRKKLQQAVTNVLSNAYKYSPGGGGVELDVLVPSADSPAEIGLRITDHGIGMTPAQCQRVGERFFRVDTSGKIPGTGLGMAIVKEIVALHRGRLEITSAPGQGTQVTLWIPAR
jgi:PAS domain S-box-containing protein